METDLPVLLGASKRSSSGHMRSRASILRVLRSIAIGVVLSLAIEARGVDLSREQQTSAILLKIPRYVRWPEDADVDSSADFLIGVLGKAAVTKVLERASRDRSVHGRPYRIIHFFDGWDVREWRKCQVLYVAESEHHRLAEILSAVAGAPLLTVSNIEDFAKRGGMVAFDTSSGKLRIYLNPRRAAGEGIEFSSRLQKIATLVE